MPDAKRPASVTLVDWFENPPSDEDFAAGRPRLPDAIDVWAVDALLGGGGEAAVFACHNRHAPRIRAAIKTTGPTLPDDPRLRERFLREARLLARLQHPHIVAVRNARLDTTPPFIEMPLIDGPGLDEVLQAGPLASEQLLRTAAGLLSAVAHLLERGIHHRDLKPENIRMGPDGPVVVDFGVAVASGEGAGEVLDGAVGTVGYLPPEWQPDAVVDGAAWDLFSLGVVLFECCTGKPAVAVDHRRTRVEQLVAVQQVVRSRPCLDPGSRSPVVLREVVKRLTSREPSARALELEQAARLLSRMAAGEAETEGELPALLRVSPEPTPEMPSGTSHSDPVQAASARRSPRAAVWGAVGLAAIGGVVLAMQLLDPSAFFPAPTGGSLTARLALELSPADPGLPVALTLDDQPFDLDHPPALVSGAHVLRARVGEDCGTGALPAWCTEVVSTLDVAETGHQHVIHTLKLPEVSPVALTVVSSGAAPEKVCVAGSSWTTCPDSGPCTVEALPGPSRTLVAQAGRCPELACGVQTDRPAGCVQASGSLQVPVTPAAPLSLTLTLDRPERGSTPTPSADRGPSLGAAITVGRFQAFLRSHPEYQPGGSAAVAKADAKYLPGWTGTEARDRFSGAPLPAGALVDGVSPLVFAAYCSRRGGLARVEDGPPKLAGRDFELRQSGDGWVALDAAGKTRPVPDGKGSLRYFTARCRR